MGLVVEAVKGAAGAVMDALAPQDIESLLAREAEIRAERSKVEPGSGADGALGLELQRVEGKLRTLRDEAFSRKRQERPAPAPEDVRVTRARAVLAEAEMGRSVAQENLAQAKTTLAEQEAEGASEKQREASIRAVTIGESNVRAAAAVVEKARAVVTEACGVVEREKLEAARSIVRAALADFTAKATAALKARLVLMEAIETARVAGVQADAPPLTFAAVPEYATTSAERLG